MFAPILVIMLGAVAVALSTRKLDRFERSYAWGALAFHVVSGFGQEWLHYSYYEFSDMHNYIDTGRLIAKLLEFDFARFSWEVLSLFLHLDTSMPVEVRGDGNPTGSMSAVSGAITFLTGPSVLAVCLVIAIVACLSQIATYKALRDDHPVQERRILLVGLLLVPSVVFWSSALAKEAVAICFFGYLCAAARRLATGKGIVLNLVGVMVGGVGVGMVKPYILFPFVLAASAWFYTSRRNPQSAGIKPAYLVLAVLLAVVGLAAMGAAFPEFATSKIGETTAMQQEMGAQAGGGSYIEIGNANATSLPQQIPYVPLALLNALFRPFFFESRNAPMFAAALESTVLTVLVAALVVRFRFRRVREAVLTSPTLMFCAVFVATFAVAVGLASTNLGTLSRYRMPMMPFYATAVLLLRHRLRRPRLVAQTVPQGEVA